MEARVRDSLDPIMRERRDLPVKSRDWCMKVKNRHCSGQVNKNSMILAIYYLYVRCQGCEYTHSIYNGGDSGLISQQRSQSRQASARPGKSKHHRDCKSGRHPVGSTSSVLTTSSLHNASSHHPAEQNMAPKSSEEGSPARPALEKSLTLNKKHSWFGSIKNAVHQSALSAKAAVESLRGGNSSSIQ